MLMATGAPKAQFYNLCMLSAVRRFEDPVNRRNKGNFKIGSQFLFTGIILHAERRKRLKHKSHLDLAQI